MFGFLEREVGDMIKGRMPVLEWAGEIKKAGFGWLFATHEVEVGGRMGEVLVTLVDSK